MDGIGGIVKQPLLRSGWRLKGRVLKKRVSPMVLFLFLKRLFGERTKFSKQLSEKSLIFTEN